MQYYVEVVHLLKGQYQKKKYIQYPSKEEAEKIFTLTVKQFKEEKKEALVCLRGGGHGLIRSELLKA
jgi:hypothetical protein